MPKNKRKMKTSNEGAPPFNPLVGVLALQGAFAEHINILSRLGVKTRQVKQPADVDGIDALILPGGESTTMALLMTQYKLTESLIEFCKTRPCWGTCAGMILLSKTGTNEMEGGQQHLQALDIKVMRNAFGHQVDSFVCDLKIEHVASSFAGVFIRAPTVEDFGPNVEILCRIPERNDCVVACRQGNILACSFHPELTNDTRFHEYFLRMIADFKA